MCLDVMAEIAVAILLPLVEPPCVYTQLTEDYTV